MNVCVLTLFVMLLSCGTAASQAVQEGDAHALGAAHAAVAEPLPVEVGRKGGDNPALGDADEAQLHAADDGAKTKRDAEATEKKQTGEKVRSLSLKYWHQ